MKRLSLAASVMVLVGAAALGSATAVDAWGSTGHRTVGVAAVRALPDDLPAFLRSPGAAAEVGELSREPDRWKGSGQPHDRERDTAHFVDLTDEGHVVSNNAMTLDQLPELKSQYDAQLLAAGVAVNDAGYLPYAIMDGWQQLVRDFGYWRVLDAVESRETDPGKRAWYREDRLRREALILRDLGILSHYVGDASQPLHVSVHYNGWGDYPNPERFTNSRQTHGLFENAYVRRATRLDAVEAAMPAAKLPETGLDGFDMKPRVVAYLKESLTHVIPFYQLEKAGAFADGDARGAEFATMRLAVGAAELRDMTIMAWRASATTTVGWPVIKVDEVEAGTVDPWESLIGAD